MHGSPTCLPGPSLLYCDHGPRSPSSLSAAVTSGTGRAALFLPSNALVSRVSPRCGYDMPQQRRRRCRASQGTKKGRRPRRRPRLKLSDRAGPDQWPVPGENALFPAQIAGFLAVSRPVPVYPVFLNYVVPVQRSLTSGPARFFRVLCGKQRLRMYCPTHRSFGCFSYPPTPARWQPILLLPNRMVSSCP